MNYNYKEEIDKLSKVKYPNSNYQQAAFQLHCEAIIPLLEAKDKEIEALKERWFPVSVFMPSSLTQKLRFKMKDGTIYEGAMILTSWVYWTNNDQLEAKYDDVIEWQPLPEKP